MPAWTDIWVHSRAWIITRQRNQSWPSSEPTKNVRPGFTDSPAGWTILEIKTPRSPVGFSLQIDRLSEPGATQLGNKLNFYRSVQLMQGSIDSTIVGTSERNMPGSMWIRAGMLAKVGVLIRSRSRYFPPFALI
jgi:hypothetical protein